MAYSTPPSVSAGQVATAAQLNTYRAGLEEVVKPPLIWAYSTTAQPVAHNVVATMNLQATYSIRGFTLASNLITPAESGHFVVVVRLQWGPHASGVRAIRFLVNNTLQIEEHASPGNVDWRQHGLTYGPFPADNNDQFKVELFQNSGVSLNAVNGSSIAVHMVSRL